MTSFDAVAGTGRRAATRNKPNRETQVPHLLSHTWKLSKSQSGRVLPREPGWVEGKEG